MLQNPSARMNVLLRISRFGEMPVIQTTRLVPAMLAEFESTFKLAFGGCFPLNHRLEAHFEDVTSMGSYAPACKEVLVDHFPQTW